MIPEHPTTREDVVRQAVGLSLLVGAMAAAAVLSGCASRSAAYEYEPPAPYYQRRVPDDPSLELPEDTPHASSGWRWRMHGRSVSE